MITLGLLLRLYRLGEWTPNEVATDLTARSALGVVWAFMAQSDPYHPPLFPILLHLWRYLGTDDLLLRLLPVLFGTLSIWLVYRVPSFLCDRRIGLLAAFILAVSPFHIWHSQELRMYSALFFFSMLSLDALVRLLRDDRPVHWVVYVAATTLSLYTDYGALLILAAHNAVVLVLSFFRQGPRLWKWAAAQSVIVAFFLPWTPVLLSLLRPHGPVAASEEQFPYSGLQIGAAPQLANVAFIIATFASAFLPQGRPIAKIAVVLFLGAAFLSGMWMLRRRPVAILTLSMQAILPIALGVGLSYELGALRPRTVISASAGYYMLLAAGIVALPRRLGQFVLAALIAVNLYSLNLMFHHPDKAMGWGQAARFIHEQLRAGDGVVFVDGIWRPVFDRYYPAPARLEATGYPAPHDLDQIKRFVDAHRVIYLVRKQEERGDPGGLVRSYVAAQAATPERREFPGAIIIERYRR